MNAKQRRVRVRSGRRFMRALRSGKVRVDQGEIVHEHHPDLYKEIQASLMKQLGQS